MRLPARFLLLLILCALFAPGPAFASAVRDFSFVPMDHAVELSFSASGQDEVVVLYSNSFEKGRIPAFPTDGRFTVRIGLPATWPGNNVAVTIQSVRGKTLMDKTYVQTATEEIPPVEKAASGRLSGVTVCVDPGHQGIPISVREPLGPGLRGWHHTTNGQAQGVRTRRFESAVTLEIGLLLRNALLLEGADVVMTRENQQTSVSNVRRAEIANEAQADFFIRLHCDANRNPKKRGVSVYLPLNSANARAVADRKTYRAYGEAMLQALLEETGAGWGIVRQNNDYVASNWAAMPAFLIEMGFMSNEEDDLLLSDPEYRRKLVSGMVEGLVQAASMRGLR